MDKHSEIRDELNSRLEERNPFESEKQAQIAADKYFEPLLDDSEFIDELLWKNFGDD